MRTLTIGFLAATALCGISTASAADLDYDYLRGPEYEPVSTQIIDWSGFYVGGHGGYATSGFGYKNVFDTITGQALGGITTAANTSNLGLLSSYEARSSGATYGAFAGYNLQFDELVIGLEADYTRLGQSARISGFDFTTSTDQNGTLSSVVLNGESRTKLLEYGTIRTRIGYAFENLLPYVTAGVAVGSARAVDTAVAYPYTALSSAPSVAIPGVPAGYIRSKFDLVAGLVVGAGVEYAINSNLILRGEYQYVSFDKIYGHYFDVNSFRGGAAYKF